MLSVYERLGWWSKHQGKTSKAANRAKWPNLMFEEAVRMAWAVGAPSGPFLVTMAESFRPEHLAISHLQRHRWPGFRFGDAMAEVRRRCGGRVTARGMQELAEEMFGPPLEIAPESRSLSSPRPVDAVVPRRSGRLPKEPAA